MRTPRHARLRYGAAVASVVLVSTLAGAPTHASDGLDPLLGDPGRALPNLVPTVTDVQIQPYRVTEFGTEHGLFLWFDTRAQNLGYTPLQLTVEDVESLETSTVSQCVSWRSVDANICRMTEPVGGFTWHGDHMHFHYTDFAAYELRRVHPNGRPDYSGNGLVGKAEKVSFCLIDSQQVREGARPVPLYSTCLPTVQGISAGWTDIYDSYLPGQNLSIDGLPDGQYVLIITIDHANTIREADNKDNVVEVTLEISGGASIVSIVDRRWPSLDERGGLNHGHGSVEPAWRR